MENLLPTKPGFNTLVTTKTGLRGHVFYRCEDPGDGREPFVRMRSDKLRGGIHDVPMSKIRKVEYQPCRYIDGYREDGTRTLIPNPHYAA